MRRVPRILLNAATVISLFVFLTALVIWVVSLPDFRIIRDEKHLLVIIALNDGARESFRRIEPESFRGGWLSWVRTKSRSFKVMGIESHYTTDPSYKYVVLVVPYWSLTLISSLLPTIWLIRMGLRRRAGPQPRCDNCGYDLRATPECCPECGTVPTEQVNSLPGSGIKKDRDKPVLSV